MFCPLLVKVNSFFKILFVAASITLFSRLPRGSVYKFASKPRKGYLRPGCGDFEDQKEPDADNDAAAPESPAQKNLETPGGSSLHVKSSGVLKAKAKSAINERLRVAVESKGRKAFVLLHRLRLPAGVRTFKLSADGELVPVLNGGGGDDGSIEGESFADFEIDDDGDEGGDGDAHDGGGLPSEVGNCVLA